MKHFFQNILQDLKEKLTFCVCVCVDGNLGCFPLLRTSQPWWWVFVCFLHILLFLPPSLHTSQRYSWGVWRNSLRHYHHLPRFYYHLLHFHTDGDIFQKRFWERVKTVFKNVCICDAISPFRDFQNVILWTTSSRGQTPKTFWKAQVKNTVLSFYCIVPLLENYIIWWLFFHLVVCPLLFRYRQNSLSVVTASCSKSITAAIVS